MERDRIGVWEDHGDHLCFKEIARAWSKVSADNPKMLTEALVSAFWRGEFETDGQSALFILLPPDSAKFERRPGNYATRGEVVVKVAEDLQSNVTADRKKSPILREVVAYMLYRPAGQRAIVSGYAADFAKWSDDKRDLAYPNWRAEHEDVYRAHSTTPFEQWPTGPVDMRYYCSRWCIRRHDFARWYRISSLSAGAPLDSFWPLPAMDPLKGGGPVSPMASADVVEGSTPGRESLGCPSSGALRQFEVFSKGGSGSVEVSA